MSHGIAPERVLHATFRPRHGPEEWGGASHPAHSAHNGGAGREQDDTRLLHDIDELGDAAELGVVAVLGRTIAQQLLCHEK